MLFHKILRRFGIWLSYVLIVITSFICFAFFRFPFNFARVYGRKNIPRKGNNILFLANHDTMYDSFLIGGAAFFPRNIMYPAEPFVNFAAQENFFTTWYVKLLMRLLRTEPVERRNQASLMKKFVRLLSKRNLLIFYQGTRSKNLTAIKDGPAYAIRMKKPTPLVVPVYHEGMDRIFSRGGPATKGFWRWFPRSILRRPKVIFGKPINFSDLLDIQDRKECIKEINARIVAAIISLQRRQ